MAADELGNADPRSGVGEIRAHIEEALWLTNRYTEPDSGRSVGDLRSDKLTGELLKLPQQAGRASSYGVHTSDSGERYDPRGFVDDRAVPDSERALELKFVDLLANSDIDLSLRKRAAELIPYEHLSRGGSEARDGYNTVQARAGRGTETNLDPTDESKRLRQEFQSVTSELAAAVLARHCGQVLNRLEPTGGRNLSEAAVERTVGALKGHAHHIREGVKEMVDPSPEPARSTPLQAATRAIDQGAGQPPGDDTPTVDLPARPAGPRRGQARNRGTNQAP